MVVVAPDGVV
jgi:hypothetical protein